MDFDLRNPGQAAWNCKKLDMHGGRAVLSNKDNDSMLYWPACADDGYCAEPGKRSFAVSL
jgi:hypothetical protein